MIGCRNLTLQPRLGLALDCAAYISLPLLSDSSSLCSGNLEIIALFVVGVQNLESVTYTED